MNATTHQQTIEADRARLEDDACCKLGASDGLNTVCIDRAGHEGDCRFVPSHNLRGLDAAFQPVYRDR